ncbi:MAG: GAF domain-containing protein [Proteobacteria bacterium]|nr:GAF domain-containing protein [Pseudomonadota bacterium]
MRYVVVSDDGRTLEVSGTDWMMAMVEVIDRQGLEVSGWICETADDGSIRVMDIDTNRHWDLWPIGKEQLKQPRGRPLKTPPMVPAGLGQTTSLEQSHQTRYSPIKVLEPGPSSLDSLLDAPPSPHLSRTVPTEPFLPPSAENAPTVKEVPQAETPVLRAEEEEEPAPAMEEPTPEGLKAALAEQMGLDNTAAMPRPGTSSIPRRKPRRRRDSLWVPPRGANNLQKPMWSPSYRARTGSAPKQASEKPPSNLAERLFELSMKISSQTDPNKACYLALDLAMGLIPSEAGSVVRGGINEPCLRFVATAGPAADEILGKLLPYGMGILGTCFDLGITVLVNDVGKDERFSRIFDHQTGFTTRSTICTTVRTDDVFLEPFNCLIHQRGFYLGMLTW